MTEAVDAPAPIDGWVFFRDPEVWTARCPHDSEVTVYIAEGCFCFSDETTYYPAGGVDAPLAVMWKLIELNGLKPPA